MVSVKYENFGYDHSNNKYLRVFQVRVELYPWEIRQQWACLQLRLGYWRRLHTYEHKNQIVKGTSPKMV